MRTAGLLALAVLTLPLVAQAAFININTADAALLDTLPGIGPSKAAAIVDYRTQQGPFARVEDIQNVSGIGPTTYANLESFITVADTISEAVPAVASSTPSTSPSPGTTITYVPPPSALSVTIQGAPIAFLEVPFALSAQVEDRAGKLDTTARITWSFGDGSRGEGSSVEKTYRYAGTYLIVATASDGTATARDDFSVTVQSAGVRISTVSGEGITLTNDSIDRLDLSGWRLTSSTGSFRIPEGMTILPSASVLLPFTITNLPIALDAALWYPDGVLAVRYLPPALAPVTVVQPPATTTSYEQIQEVEPIISTRTDVQSYEEAVLAPTTTTELAAVGAAASASASGPNIFKSPWTLSFLGLMTLAGGAFILL